MIFKKIVSLFLALFFLIILTEVALAGSEEFVTIVNPVRISRYTKNPRESIAAQYQIVRELSLPATWILTYDVIEKEVLTDFFKEMDEKQELGIFLEVTPGFANASGVTYHETGFWHHATSVFLSGYTQEERIKLIDKVFEKFKEAFGYYPKVVGSWWTDSYSLSYLKEKYGVIVNLGLADQYSTDGYQVWGTPWQIPYYPSRYHSGIPAVNDNTKLDVVMLQWAPRDPYNGYKSSLYSTQDYSISRIGLETDFFEKLVRFYGKKNSNSFGQIVVGLEGDLEPQTYRGEYLKQLELVTDLLHKGEFKVVTAGEFADWYRGRFPNLPQSHFFESGDLLGKEQIRAFWYQSPSYRIGILYKKDSQKVKIFDFRTYHEDLEEPYYFSPNKEFQLAIYIPSYFDEIVNTENIWEFSLEELIEVKKEEEKVIIGFKDRKKIVLTPSELSFPSSLELPRELTRSKILGIKESGEVRTITPRDRWIVGKEGVTFRSLTMPASHFLATKRGMLTVLMIGVLFLAFGLLASRLLKGKRPLAFLVVFLLYTVLVGVWYFKNSETYLVNQAEVDTLTKLSLLPEGKVLIYDRECLWCSFETKFRPAVFANKRSYVRKIGRHPTVYNLSVFTADNQVAAREEFEKLGVDYIYIVKYEDYAEKTPFSPGDLGIEKIYANANSELWRVKK